MPIIQNDAKTTKSESAVQLTGIANGKTTTLAIKHAEVEQKPNYQRAWTVMDNPGSQES